MGKLSKTKRPDNIEQAITKYWKAQRHWNGQVCSDDTVLTTSQAIRILSNILNNSRLPKQLRNQVAEFQQEIINNTRRRIPKGKQSIPTFNVISIC